MIPDQPDRPSWRPQVAKPLSLEERQRLARAYAMKARPDPVAPAAPSRRATSSEPCGRCGIPGVKGCAHQLPYERPEGDHRTGRLGPRMSIAWDKNSSSNQGRRK